jgi:hypothetical protein
MPAVGCMMGTPLLAHLQLDGDPAAPEAVSDQANLVASQGTRLTKRVSIPIDQACTIAYGGPPAVGFREGLVIGDLRIERLRIPDGAPEAERALITFDFRDEEGQAWRHVAVSAANFFWPAGAAQVSPRTTGGDYCIADTLDGRDDAYFDLDTGERIVVRLKYFGFDAAMTPGDNAATVRVHAIMGPVVDHPLAVQDHLGVEYEVPVFDLLWRRATGIWAHDCDLEGGNFIDLRPLESTDPSLPRSPIRVIDEGPVEAVNPGRHDPKRRYVPGKVDAETQSGLNR